MSEADDLFASRGDAPTAPAGRPSGSVWDEARPERPAEPRGPIAEVIASSTRSVEAEVYESAPDVAFGSWVEVEGPQGTRLFGLVSHVAVGSLDPGRRVRAYGLTPDELARERPHVPGLIVTTLRAQLLAHARDDRLRQSLPPYAAPLHHAVRLAAPDDVRALGAPFDYLRTLALNPDPGVPVDELLVAALRAQRDAHLDEATRERTLIAAAQTLSRLMRDDHERLGSILRRAVD